LTERAAEFLGRNDADLETLALGKEAFLKNLRASIAGAFQWIEPSQRAEELAERAIALAIIVAETMNSASSSKDERDAAQRLYLGTWQALHNEVTACPPSQMAKGLDSQAIK
jgi:hypothetical protein